MSYIEAMEAMGKGETYKISLRKKVKKNTREVVCMVVGIAQLVGHSIKEQVSAFCVKLQNKVLEDIHWSTVSDGC
jgi:hypothetical protein